MINKCFRRDKPWPDGNVTHEYICINGLPMVQSTRTSVHLNECQLPAIHFLLCDKTLAPYEKHEGDGSEPVFWFDTVFTGELPEPYKGRAYNALREPEFVEIDRSEYIWAMEKRFAEFKANLFEPTTPPL